MTLTEPMMLHTPAPVCYATIKPETKELNKQKNMIVNTVNKKNTLISALPLRPWLMSTAYTTAKHQQLRCHTLNTAPCSVKCSLFHANILIQQ